MAETIDKDGRQVRADKSACTGRLLPPPVGTSDWARFSRTSYCVDKTLILKALIDAESNRESGEGRYDISLRPLVDAIPGVVIELKAEEEETEDLDALAREARRQIYTREYTTEMLADFVAHGEKRDILKFGMAFYKKNLVVCKDLPDA